MAARILLIEDDQSMAHVYQKYLEGGGYSVNHVENGKAAIKELSAGNVDLAIVDLRLPDMDGFAILRYVTEKQIPADVVVITGEGSMNTAIEAMKLGASDFLVKPFNKDRLVITVKNSLERQKLDRTVKIYREEIDRHEYQGFIGSSLIMQGVYRIIDSAAQSKVPVFISGESGTGKEVCAAAIHQANEGANKPFVAINCGAIPKELIESEIFGHVKGAFTGAVADRKGAAMMADGGTLFLDEICEMDIALQPKLLRFLQTGKVQPVGSNKIVDVDVRIVCATNRDPLVEVAAGRFREDLYYRLHVLPIQLPALKGRSEDMLEIANHFLSVYSAEEGKSFKGFESEVENAFLAYSWPGNVRQLQNVIRNIVVLHDSDMIDVDMLPAPLDGDTASFSEGRARVLHPESVTTNLPNAVEFSTPSPLAASDINSIRPLAEMEFEMINNALAICGGNVPQAAHYLGISAATIYRKKSAWKNQVASMPDQEFA